MHARIIQVFVSSPGDVSQEREVLEEIVQTVNRDTGQSLSLRLELFRWEVDVVPQIGPKPQRGVDQQTPVYDVYLGILSTRFGTPTGRYGSGTEKEFKDTLSAGGDARWDPRFGGKRVGVVCGLVRCVSVRDGVEPAWS